MVFTKMNSKIENKSKRDPIIIVTKKRGGDFGSDFCLIPRIIINTARIGIIYAKIVGKVKEGTISISSNRKKEFLISITPNISKEIIIKPKIKK
jgi:hypothetical protein